MILIRNKSRGPQGINNILFILWSIRRWFFSISICFYLSLSEIENIYLCIVSKALRKGKGATPSRFSETVTNLILENVTKIGRETKWLRSKTFQFFQLSIKHYIINLYFKTHLPIHLQWLDKDFQHGKEEYNKKNTRITAAYLSSKRAWLFITWINVPRFRIFKFTYTKQQSTSGNKIS